MAELIIQESRSGMEACAPIGHGIVSLGRDDTNDIVLEYGNISRRHCEIEYSDEGCLVRDFGSKGGSYIADERIQDTAPWFPGEELRIGTCRIRLKERVEPELPKALKKAQTKKRPAKDPKIAEQWDLAIAGAHPIAHQSTDDNCLLIVDHDDGLR